MCVSRYVTVNYTESTATIPV